MRTWARIASLTAVLFLYSSTHDARAQSPGGASLRITDAEGRPAAAMVVPKGVPVTFTGRATGTDGGPIPVEWRTEPAGVLRVESGADGRVTVTPLRDVFDDPRRREPVARVQACTPTLCAAITITVVPDITGRWPTTLDVEDLIIAHSERRNLVFNQRGRDVTFDPEPTEPAVDAPARMATIRIEGTRLRLVRAGTIMTVFDGTLSGRTSASGRWASSRGYHGTWRANRAP